jgi:hypothetical protein
MAARAVGRHHIRIQALDLYFAARHLGHRPAVRSRAAHRLSSALGAAAMPAVVIAVIVTVFAAVGAPVWLGVAFALVSTVPVILAARRARHETVVGRHGPGA